MPLWYKVDDVHDYNLKQFITQPSGARHERRFPEGADMKLLRGFFISAEAFFWIMQRFFLHK